MANGFPGVVAGPADAGVAHPAGVVRPVIDVVPAPTRRFVRHTSPFTLATFNVLGHNHTVDSTRYATGPVRMSMGIHAMRPLARGLAQHPGRPGGTGRGGAPSSSPAT